MKTTLLIIAGVLAGGLVHASQEAVPSGQSVLKLDQTPPAQDAIRDSRKALDAVENDIAELNRKIEAARALAARNRASAGSDSALAATFESQATFYEIERDNRLKDRAKLRAELREQ